MKNIFKINVFTYVFLMLSMLSGYFREIFLVFIILIIHELGHFFLMKIMNVEVSSITIYPYGGMIKSNMLVNTNSLKVILISLAGVFMQLLLWIFILFFYKLGLFNTFYYDLFFKYNLYIIIFNLIPIYPLDGYKIFNSILELFFSFKKSIYLSFIVNVFCLILFLVYLYIYKISNYLIIIFLLVNLVNYMKEMKYIVNKFYIERIIYDLKFSGLISIKEFDNMYKNKLNYINGINEKNYLINKYNIY